MSTEKLEQKAQTSKKPSTTLHQVTRDGNITVRVSHSAVHIESGLDRVIKVKKGLDAGALKKFLTITHFSLEDSARVLGMSTRTLTRKREVRRLDPQLSDRILQLEDLYTYGADVFGSKERFRLWISEPTQALGNRRPLDVLDTQAGVELIETLLGRIEHGVLA